MESTVEERILLHLRNYTYKKNSRTAAYSVSQQGIADAVGTSLSQVSRVVRQMKKDGLVLEDKKYLKHDQERKRKVYYLTPRGIKKEKEVRNKFSSSKLTIKTAEGDKNVDVGELKEYIGDDDALLNALVHADNDGVIDLLKKKGVEKTFFVDREKELEGLQMILDDVVEEGCRVVVIRGEVGIGKTSLCMRFKKYAKNKGFDFLNGRAHFETSEPYLSFKKAFEKYVEEEDAFEVDSNLLPIGFKRVGVEEYLTFDKDRDASFSEVNQAIKKIAKKQPLVIFLDDLQWADNATLQLLHFLANNLKKAPVLFMVAVRPEDIPASHPLAEIHGYLSGTDILEEITIEPFALNHSRELLHKITGNSRLPNDFVELIHRVTQGHPLFLVEFTELLIDEGKIPPDTTDYPTREDELEIPKVIEDVLQRRLNLHLSQKARKVLEWGSIIGYEVPFDLLESISIYEELELLEIIDELLERNIWYEEPEKETFVFSHTLIGRVVYRDIPSVKKKRLHVSVAKNIIEIYSDNLEKYYSDLGYHFEKGGDDEEAAKYYILGGEEAERVFAHEDAIEMYNKALDLTDDEAEKIDVNEKLGLVYKTMDDFDTAMNYFQVVLDECEDDILRCKMLCEISGILFNKGDSQGAKENIEKGLELCSYEEDIICELLNRKGWVYLREGYYKDARKIFQDERKNAEKCGDKKLTAQAFHDLGTVNFLEGRYEDSEKMLKKALNLREEMGDIKGASASINNLGVLYRKIGDLDKAITYHEKDLDLAEKYGHKRDISMALNNMGLTYRDRGSFDQAMRYLERAQKINEEIGDRSGASSSLHNIGTIYHERGDYEKAEEYHEKAAELMKEINSKTGLIYALDSLGKAYRGQGDLDNSKRHHQQALELCEEMDDLPKKTIALLGLARVNHNEGELDEALSLAKNSLELSEDLGVHKEEGLAHWILGNIYRDKGELETASEEYDKSIDVLQSMGEVINVTKVKYDHGLLMVECGEEEKGTGLIKRALEDFRKMGMKEWERKAEKALKRL